MDKISPARLPPFSEIENEFMHLSDNRQGNLKAATAITFALASIAIILRITARKIGRSVLQADDYTILAAWVSGATPKGHSLFACDSADSL